MEKSSNDDVYVIQFVPWLNKPNLKWRPPPPKNIWLIDRIWRPESDFQVGNRYIHIINRQILDQYYMYALQGWRKVWKSGVASSNTAVFWSTKIGGLRPTPLLSPRFRHPCHVFAHCWIQLLSQILLKSSVEIIWFRNSPIKLKNDYICIKLLFFWMVSVNLTYVSM